MGKLNKELNKSQNKKNKDAMCTEFASLLAYVDSDLSNIPDENKKQEEVNKAFKEFGNYFVKLIEDLNDKGAGIEKADVHEFFYGLAVNIMLSKEAIIYADKITSIICDKAGILPPPTPPRKSKNVKK